VSVLCENAVAFQLLAEAADLLSHFVGLTEHFSERGWDLIVLILLV
jgi:hypothetical protein